MSKSKQAIKALRDTDYKDPESHFKMVQLLKGLAAASKEDKEAKAFLDAVSDAMTSAAKKVMKESIQPVRGEHLHDLQEADPSTWPSAKFKVGDKVKIMDGREVLDTGVISSVGTYDDYLSQYRYKVKTSSSRKTWNEKSLIKEGASNPVAFLIEASLNSPLGQMDRRGDLSESFDDGKMVFHAKTRGGRFEIKAFENPDGSYTIRAYKSGKGQGSSVGVPPSKITEKLAKQIADALNYDNIKYKAVINDLGVKL